jgi:hypothetical protein
MSEERAEHYIGGHDGQVPPIEKIIATHRLAHQIEAGHKNGALYLLAAYLEPLLKEFQAKNELLTTAELEMLIAVAARAMVNEAGLVGESQHR